MKLHTCRVIQREEYRMDIQKIIAEAVKALTENEELLREFNKNPGKTLEK